MQAGRLRERLAIQGYAVVADGMGGETQSWSTLATVWGQVRMVAGLEQYSTAADQVQGTVTHKVNLRQNAGDVALTVRHRFNWGGRILQIVSIGDMEGRRREQVVLCREVV